MYAADTGSSPVLLTKLINIALSSDYWIFGIIIAKLLSNAMDKLWESFSTRTKELVMMTMFTIFITLIAFAASEELV